MSHPKYPLLTTSCMFRMYDADFHDRQLWILVEDQLPTTFGFVTENTYYKIRSVKNKTFFKDDNRKLR